MLDNKIYYLAFLRAPNSNPEIIAPITMATR